MSNNDLDNDLDVENFDDGGFDDFNKKNSLGDVWRNNPMVKIGVLLAAIAVIVGGFILFGGSNEVAPGSAVNSASEVSEAPGTTELSATQREAYQERNEERAEIAARTGGSAIPTPIEPAKTPIPIPADEEAGEDPLERWRRMQEERIRQQEMLSQAQTQQQTPGEPPVDTKTPAVNALSQAMVTQMQSVLNNQGIKPPSYKRITSANFIQQKQEEQMSKQQQQQQQQQQIAMSTSGQYSQNQQVENIILPAGTIEYGQLLLEANTDAPGPILAQIMSGPLKGSRVIGGFQSTDQYLVLNFTTVVIDGINYQTQAVAIDPGTTLPGLITEIDNRYFKRIILPMAAEFVSGLADAISESGTTSVFITDSSVTQSSEDKDSRQEAASGISEAGEKLGDILDEEAERTRPMLRVASGTPIGILFVTPVSELESGR